MARRVTPDSNDIVVWKLDESGTTFYNSSTNPGYSDGYTQLTSSGTILNQQVSLFAKDGYNTCVYFTGAQTSSPRNSIKGAENVEPQPPFTISFWLKCRYLSSGISPNIFGKRYSNSIWTGDGYSENNSQIGFRRHGADASTIYTFFVKPSSGKVVVEAKMNDYVRIPLELWTHVGMTYDGYTLDGYINGEMVASGTNTVVSSVNYASHGAWFFGAIPSQGSANEPYMSILDFRIANTIRPLSYFKELYVKGAYPGYGYYDSITTYYKLRAYDNTCSPPSAVYWVDTVISLVNAPASPCGGSLTSLEVVESWGVINA